MSEPVERIFAAKVASEGLAQGVIHLLRDGHGGTKGRVAGSPADERELLRRAAEATSLELTQMIAEATGKTEALLRREIQLLSEASFMAPVWQAVAGGEPAESALGDALDFLAEDRRGEGDTAQAEELADLRDRILKHLPGGGLDQSGLPGGAIVVAHELTPTRFLDLDCNAAVA